MKGSHIANRWLGIALAFVGEPDAVVVDDVESQLTMPAVGGSRRSTAGCSAHAATSPSSWRWVERDPAAK